MTLDTHDFISSYQWKRSDWSFDGGVFLKIQDNFSNPNTGIRRLIPDYIRTESGNYFTSSFSLSNDFSLGFGFRYTNQYNHVKKYYKNTRWEEENFQDRLGDFVIDEILSQKLIEQKLIFNNISINVGVKFPVLEHMKFNLNLFHTERAPDIAELFSDGLHHSLATIEYGNPFLKSEKTQKLLINFEKRTGDLKFNISPYFTNGQNYIVIEPSGFEYTIRGAFPVWEYRSLSSTIRGVDLDFNYELNDYLKFSSNSSWIEGFEKNNKTPLINIPPFSTNNYLQVSIPKWKSFLFIFPKIFLVKIDIQIIILKLLL